MKAIKLNLVAILCFTCFVCEAQVDLQNTGTVFITTGSTLYINGSFTNTSAGALTNNGSFYVRQNITNGQTSMPVGTGTLYLTGGISQTIGGTQPYRANNLQTNSVGITLANNLHVSGLHTYTAGVISTGVNYLVYESGSSHSGSVDAAHVNGWVKRLGSTNFTYPTGNGTYLRPLTLTNLSAVSEFNVKYFNTTPNLNNLQTPLVTVDPNEYWDITRVSGGTAQVALNWDDSKIAFPNFATY